jgi:hypothetical protein
MQIPIKINNVKVLIFNLSIFLQLYKRMIGFVNNLKGKKSIAFFLNYNHIFVIIESNK